MRRASALLALLTVLVATPALAQTEEPPPAEPPPAEAPSEPPPSEPPSEEPPAAAEPRRAEPPATPPSTAATSRSAEPAPRPTAEASPNQASRGAAPSSGRTTGASGSASAGSGRAPRYEDPDYARTGPREDDEEEEPPAAGGDPYDFLWIEAFGGLSYVDLRALSQNNFYPDIVRLQGEGPAGGAAVGFRIEFVSIGVRAAVAHYGDEFDVGTAIGEIALRLPLPIVKPYLRAGFGFAWHGDSDYMAPADSQTTVFGWAFSAAVGLDIYLVEWFAIGAAFNVDVLNMSRNSFDDPMPAPGEVVFEDPGDAVGVQLRGQLAVSFHF